MQPAQPSLPLMQSSQTLPHDQYTAYSTDEQNKRFPYAVAALRGGLHKQAHQHCAISVSALLDILLAIDAGDAAADDIGSSWVVGFRMLVALVVVISTDSASLRLVVTTAPLLLSRTAVQHANKTAVPGRTVAGQLAGRGAR